MRDIHCFSCSAVIEKFETNEYRDKCGVFESFFGHVQKCWDRFHSDRKSYLSPYIALFQNPGYGKSTLLREIANQTNVYVLYLSFAESDTAIPPRSPSVDDLLTIVKSCKNEIEAKNVFYNFLMTSLKFLEDDPKFSQMNPKQLFKLQNRNAFWKEVCEHLSTVGTSKVFEKRVIFAFDEARSCSLVHNNFVEGVSYFRIIRRALAELFPISK